MNDITAPPGWQVTDVDGSDRLEREFRFDDFRQALAFANQVGDIAEEANHHPQLTVSWGKVRVAWWSHDEGGITGRDLDLAEKTQTVYGSQREE